MRASQAFDDANIALRSMAKRSKRFLIPVALVRGLRLLDAVEFNDHDTLVEASFVCFDGIAAHEKPSSRSLYRRTSQLGIGGECHRVIDGAIRVN